MAKNFLVVFIGLCVGCMSGYVLFFLIPSVPSIPLIFPIYPIVARRNVVGFLPYWLIGKAKTDYSPYITTLTYFSVTAGADGKIVKQNDQHEAEPGWNALMTKKANKFFTKAHDKGVALSLAVASGDPDAINEMIKDPVPHAKNLMKDIVPVMHQYGFTDLNLDIESTTNNASDEARTHFTQFVKEVKKELMNQHAGTLTVEISASDLIKKDLINPKDIASVVDSIVIMAYDYHYQGSLVTGPVAPLSGAGTVLEYDTNTAIQKALAILPAGKIIVGIPLYGYEWETLSADPHAAVIPGTGLTASTSRVEQLEASCATCSAQKNTKIQESYLIFRDGSTGTFHQIFYPDGQSTQAKVTLAEQNNLGGIALWALGYESPTILTPLKQYKQ